MKNFDAAVKLLPQELRPLYSALGDEDRRTAEELRLRSGRAPAVLMPEGERELGRGTAVTPSMLASVIEIATLASAHSAAGLRRGYISAKGGHRVGVCGHAVVTGGEISGMRDISSVSVRIARQFIGAGSRVARGITGGGIPASTLIISPPGSGKTTLLRDIVRIISDSGVRVGLADERGEVAAMLAGVPQFDIGRCTDVMEGAGKAEAMLMLLRSMSPAVIAADEITAPEDIKAAVSVSNCGVRLIATAHAQNVGELRARPMYRELLEHGIFTKAVVVEKRGGKREYRIEDLEEAGKC